MPRLRPTEQLDEIGKKVCLRYDEGLRYAANFRQRIDLLAPYIEPTRSNVQSSQAPGQALLSRMYDSEGISAADLAVRQISSYLHGPNTHWHGLEDANDFVNLDDDAREWYEECNGKMLKQAEHGAFYPESYEADMDWMGFGTGFMMIEERPVTHGQSPFGFRGSRFTHHKAGRFVVFENGIGQVDESYVELKKTAKAAKELWGIENLPEDVQQAYNNGKVDEFRFIHGIYPRQSKEQTYGNKAMPWASCYVHYDKKKVVFESGYEEFPAVCDRWTRCHGEPYGRGLGEIALNALITINASYKLDLESAALSSKPALAQRHDAVIGAKRFSPWGVTVVRVAHGESVQNAIAPINTLGDYKFGQIKEEELRKMVRRIFYADALEQLMALEGQQEMRVYVFQQKQNIVQKMLGPTYGRWQSDFGIPYVARLFNMMYRKKQFSPPPDIILQYGGQPQARFDSPLARAQRMEEIDSMNQAMSALTPIVQLQLQEWEKTGKRPRQFVLDHYDYDKYASRVNRNYGVPAAVTLGERELKALRGSYAEAEQQQGQTQELVQAAESAGKAAPALKLLTESKKAA